MYVREKNKREYICAECSFRKLFCCRLECPEHQCVLFLGRNWEGPPWCPVRHLPTKAVATVVVDIRSSCCLAFTYQCAYALTQGVRRSTHI